MHRSNVGPVGTTIDLCYGLWGAVFRKMLSSYLGIDPGL